MAETLGSFRIIEEQPTGGRGKSANDNDVGGKVLPERQISGTGQSSQVGGTSLKDSGGTAIELESNTSSLKFDASSRVAETGIDTDVYSENPVSAYAITEAEAEYAEMVALLGDAYGKIFNVEGLDALTQAAEEFGQYRRKPLDPAKMDALSKGMIYGSLKQVVSELEAKANPSSSPAANGGGSGGGSSDGYSPVKDKDGSNTSNNALRPLDLNIPISDLGSGINPYEDVLPSIDELIAEMYEPEETNYDETDETAGGDDAVYNNGPNSYFNINGLKLKNFNLEGTSKWDLRGLPDAMSNMFDVYFRICDNDTDFDGKRLDPEASIASDLFGSKLLSARIQTIEIPAYERATTQVSAWGATLERPTDVINTPGQSSFSIRGDTRLLYVDFMNELSGTSIADYFSKGSSLYGEAEKLKISKTAEFMEDANQKIKDAKKKLEDATKDANDAAQEEIDAIKAEAVEKYKELKKTSEEQKKFMEKVEARAKSQNISIAQAQYEQMIEEEESAKSQLKKVTKQLQETAAAEADGFWAAQQEKRKIKKEVNKAIKAMDEVTKERTNAMDNALKNASKKITKAKVSKLKASFDALVRNADAGPKIDASNKDAVAYVTGAIARNMSVKFCGAPFESIDDLSNHKRVDIIVKRVMPGKRFRSKLTAKTDERFIFEDVKLLGCSTPISFNRESADTKDFTYNFIYKRFYKLDCYADNVQDWIESQINSYADQAVDLAINATKGALKSVL